ncbi:hypothetical protein BAC1_02156 [uncultured bacterium]|nr:hypothetical protein BAC1_02156 [uncultured bacterium]
MLEVLVWLARVEKALAASLSKKSAGDIESTRRLRKVTRGKRLFAGSLLSSASRIRAGSNRAPVLPGLKGLREDVDDSISFLSAAVEAGIDGVELAELLAFHESLKWNNLVLAIGGHVKDRFPEAVPMLVAAQRNKRAIERYLEISSRPQGFFTLRAAEPVWRERLLLIGEFCPDVKRGINGDCLVEEASGKDAIERLRERYYGAVLADEDLAGIKAAELCRKATRMFPGIEERFLFLYGGIEKNEKGKGVRRLHKSAPAGRVLEEISRILDR